MNILILSPHADDAEIGAGATIVRFKEAEHNLFWITFCPCKEPFSAKYNKETQLKESNDVVDFLGAENKTFNYDVRKLDEHRGEILNELIKVKKSFMPDLVIGPSMNDLHQDHQVVANEMVRAFKTCASIICYEIPWNFISFNTQLFVKLNAQNLEKKIQMLNFYKSQIESRPIYFRESLIRGMATLRGSQINTEYAEAFEVVRWIIKTTEKEYKPTFCL